MSDTDSILQTVELTKHFGNVVAVEGVDFSLREGEIMALVGDNGAGKSTFIKMLCGVHEPTSGEIRIDGEPIEFEDYSDAREMGIETVYQDLALAEQQTVAANVFLGQEPVRSDLLGRLLGVVDKQAMRDRARESLDRVQIPVDPDARVSDLSGGQQQAVAVARALQSDPDILILDEPTSALSIEGARNVLRVIDDLRNEGLSIILISHNIRQVLTLADRVSVLAQGRLMGVRDTDSATRDEIIALMMGAEDEDEIDEFELTSVDDSADEEGAAA
ncbi:ATP-binding cassette domain-containing protein [Halopiger aswanensis]|uniref:Monosaccharide ABC transporter ATP-binding protein (CUT2 family) n=1 Tax=Halopiger aswanensis TaxID=148449 RepID=A0A3R7DAF8_9EURY|nr:ATP-binding cassette domain-containing protein [Halopiger aswanensis]RKD95529.1 monosaccharide ABC transporter ATP-binding protein (CUT2 family) [Halopiger aswanensis]